MKLTNADWVEIYYAVKHKEQSISVKHDRKWMNHLSHILYKIGPDGCKMYSPPVCECCLEPMKKCECLGPSKKETA